MRPEQWLKNGFVLAPLVFSGLLDDPNAWGRSLLAVAAFCCASSAVYLVNDVLDREADRRHPTKCNRPIAAGEVSVGMALAAASVLVVAAMIAAFALGNMFPSEEDNEEEETVDKVDKDEEENAKSEDEEEVEVEEFKFENKTYYTDDAQNGNLFECLEDGEIGDIVGNLENGSVFFS